MTETTGVRKTSARGVVARAAVIGPWVAAMVATATFAQTLAIDDRSGAGGAQYDVHFVAADTGFVCGDHGVYRTVDGGLAWSGPLVPGAFRGIAFSSPRHGHAVGDNGLYARSFDRGATWEIQDPISSSRLRAIAFADADRGFAAGDNGALTYTEDGGDTWRTHDARLLKYDSDDRSTLTGLCFASSRVGFVAGTGGALYKTADGGQSWQRRGFDDDIGIWAITFPADSVGFASGAQSYAYKTVDQGESWTRFELPAPSGQQWSLWAIAFVNETVGVAAGGHIFFTRDGGENWERALAGGQELRGAAVRGDSMIVAVGKATRQVYMHITDLATPTAQPYGPAAAPAGRHPGQPAFRCLLNGRTVPRLQAAQCQFTPEGGSIARRRRLP
jgi:photosystem II stability/assembly factor-like uncharacterized protein